MCINIYKCTNTSNTSPHKLLSSSQDRLDYSTMADVITGATPRSVKRSHVLLSVPIVYFMLLCLHSPWTSNRHKGMTCKWGCLRFSSRNFSYSSCTHKIRISPQSGDITLPIYLTNTFIHRTAATQRGFESQNAALLHSRAAVTLFHR